METTSKILIVGEPPVNGEMLIHWSESAVPVFVPTMLRGLAMLSREEFAGIYGGRKHLEQAFDVGKLLQNEWVLEELPDGVALLDAENNIIWANRRLAEWSGQEKLSGTNFYEILNRPDIIGPDYCPFHSALMNGRASISNLQSKENHYFQVHATPIIEDGKKPQHLLTVIRDITREVLQQQKLMAIHQAGMELADLTPEELRTMSVEDRIELLKSNILHFTQDLLHFDVIEIRLLDKETSRLEPLLALGMRSDAASRELYALPQNNGVTGFVAAPAKSYLCEDTAADPLYLEGCEGAHSSLTVPLIFHEEVIGTFNVESPERGIFTENDLQFLEIFARDVAAALHTLELLVAEKHAATTRSVEAIHSAVALPIDEILLDAVHVMERYIGHEPHVVDALKRILQNARDIKEVIQEVGRKMTPTQAVPQACDHPNRPKLRSMQVLVVDTDESVRSAAHNLLERFGCVVESARNGMEAISMVRVGQYDAIIADIRLPDLNGFELLVRLQEIQDSVPMVLMTGFGYDPGHSIVKARQAGLKSVLYKPFRLDQLLDTLENFQPVPGLTRQD